MHMNIYPNMFKEIKFLKTTFTFDGMYLRQIGKKKDKYFYKGEIFEHNVQIYISRNTVNKEQRKMSLS